MSVDERFRFGRLGRPQAMAVEPCQEVGPADHVAISDESCGQLARDDGRPNRANTDGRSPARRLADRGDELVRGVMRVVRGSFKVVHAQKTAHPPRTVPRTVRVFLELS